MEVPSGVSSMNQSLHIGHKKILCSKTDCFTGIGYSILIERLVWKCHLVTIF